jgi:hypothetical protein
LAVAGLNVIPHFVGKVVSINGNVSYASFNTAIDRKIDKRHI